MTKNESDADRIIRVILGLILLYAAAYATVGIISIVLYILAIISIVTAITGFCALYKIIGIDTNKK